MPTTRAKISCYSKTLTSGYGGASYKFSAVTGESPENKVWSKWTPSLQLEIHVTNPEVSFEIGQEYYLDFTPVSQ